MADLWWSLSQSTLVATTSLLPPLEVRCTNGGGRLCQVCLPIHGRPTQIITSVFVSLGDEPFYHGSVNTGDSDIALLFANDGQLELIHSCHLVYVNATFRVVPSLFYQLFTVFSSTPITHYNKLNTTCEVHHLVCHICLFSHFPVLQFGATISSTAYSDRAFFTVPRF